MHGGNDRQACTPRRADLDHVVALAAGVNELRPVGAKKGSDRAALGEVAPGALADRFDQHTACAKRLRPCRDAGAGLKHHDNEHLKPSARLCIGESRDHALQASERSGRGDVGDGDVCWPMHRSDKIPDVIPPHSR